MIFSVSNTLLVGIFVLLILIFCIVVLYRWWYQSTIPTPPSPPILRVPVPIRYGSMLIETIQEE